MSASFFSRLIGPLVLATLQVVLPPREERVARGAESLPHGLFVASRRRADGFPLGLQRLERVGRGDPVGRFPQRFGALAERDLAREVFGLLGGALGSQRLEVRADGFGGGRNRFQSASARSRGADATAFHSTLSSRIRRSAAIGSVAVASFSISPMSRSCTPAFAHRCQSSASRRACAFGCSSVRAACSFASSSSRAASPCSASRRVSAEIPSEIARSSDLSVGVSALPRSIRRCRACCARRRCSSDSATRASRHACSREPSAASAACPRATASAADGSSATAGSAAAQSWPQAPGPLPQLARPGIFLVGDERLEGRGEIGQATASIGLCGSDRASAARCPSRPHRIVRRDRGQPDGRAGRGSSIPR
jgi:hypothetical protein